MKQACYLMGTRASLGKSGFLWLDYRAEQKKVDMRTRFCKRFRDRICDADKLVKVAESCGMRVFWKDGVPIRVLAPDTEAARAFQREIESWGWHE